MMIFSIEEVNEVEEAINKAIKALKEENQKNQGFPIISLIHHVNKLSGVTSNTWRCMLKALKN